MFAAELVELGRSRGMTVWYVDGPRRAAGSWLSDVTAGASDLAALRHWVPDVAERDVYVCGPSAWTRSVLRDLLAAGVPTDHIHLEYFGW